MKTPLRLLLPVLASAWLTAAGFAASRPAGDPTDPQLTARLRAAKTVRLEVTQRYARDEAAFDEEGGDPPASPLKISLPLAEEARRVCDLLGLRVLAVGQADLMFRIKVTGSPESREYNLIGRQYAGATLGGELSFGDRSGRLLTWDFIFTYERPEVIFYQTRMETINAVGPHASPESAPFLRTLPGFQCALLELAAQGWGREILERALKVTEGSLHAAAACVLGEQSDDALRHAMPGLIAQLKDGSDQARAAAAWALGQSGDPAALAPLLVAMDEPGRWPGERTQPATMGGLDESTADPGTRFGLNAGRGRDIFQHDFSLKQQTNHYLYAALLALAENLPAPDNDAEWRALRAALQDRHPAVRRAVLARLESFPDLRPARPALLTALRDSDAETQANALRALGKASEPADLDRVLALAKDEAEAVRLEVMALLGKFTGPRAVQALVVGMSDGHSDVQATAARALGMHPDPGVTPLLLGELAKAAADPDRLAGLVTALGQRKDPRAIGPLINLLARAEPDSR